MIGIYTLIEAIWLVLPAYGANGLCTLARGRHPIDRGFIFRGQPLFGEGKTWEGLILGTVVGAVIASVQMLAYPYLPWGLSDVTLMITPMTPLLGLALGLGAMLGDLGGSFIKRRLGLKRGAPAPVLDQEDFIAGMLIAAVLLVPVKLEWMIIIVAMTPVLHLAANFIAFRLRLKKVPY
jgi:CDP-2,3-bis-(O-geranylgeranyl)-sn-glycerol synthase